MTLKNFHKTNIVTHGGIWQHPRNLLWLDSPNLFLQINHFQLSFIQTQKHQANHYNSEKEKVQEAPTQDARGQQTPPCAALLYMMWSWWQQKLNTATFSQHPHHRHPRTLSQILHRLLCGQQNENTRVLCMVRRKGIYWLKKRKKKMQIQVIFKLKWILMIRILRICRSKLHFSLNFSQTRCISGEGPISLEDNTTTM